MHVFLFLSKAIHETLKVKIYRTKILSVALYACETWSLTLKNIYKLVMFELLPKIFCTQTYEISEDGEDCLSQHSVHQIIS